MKYVLIHNQTNKLKKPIRAGYCISFFCRLRGLMFAPTLGTYEGLLLVQSKADRVESSIHMLFMAFDLAVIWLDEQYRVVDKKACRRWHPAYFPSAAAKYVLETHLERVDDFTVGDQLSIS